MFTYQYPHPAVTVDCAVFGLADHDLNVLLIQRDLEPFQGAWALPGGFVRLDENLETAARRELEEETGVRDLFLEQLGAFGEPDRDPRERVITIAYVAIVNLFEHPVAAATDARNAGWFAADELPDLAFDHRMLVEAARDFLRNKVYREPIVFEFLPEKFTLRQVQSLYETILEVALDKRNFRKKIQATGLLIPTNEVEMDVAHRAAQLFRFDREAYEARREGGSEWLM
jgi:8-oxo-dGTP diphosphatase